MSESQQHPHEAPAYGSPQAPPTNPERNGLGLAALITGVVGILFGFIPLTFFFALILGVIGLILGLAGLSRVRKNKATNKGTTTSGAIAGVVAIALGIWGMTALFSATNQLIEDLDEISNDMKSYSDCISDSNSLDELADC